MHGAVSSNRRLRIWPFLNLVKGAYGINVSFYRLGALDTLLQSACVCVTDNVDCSYSCILSYLGCIRLGMCFVSHLDVSRAMYDKRQVDHGD